MNKDKEIKNIGKLIFLHLFPGIALSISVYIFFEGGNFRRISQGSYSRFVCNFFYNTYRTWVFVLCSKKGRRKLLTYLKY